MAIWGRSRPTGDLQARIEEIQAGLAALGDLLGSGAGTAAKAARETAGDVSNAVAPVASDIKSQMETVASLIAAFTGGLARKAGSGGKQAYDVVEEKVEDNAMLAVLAAAGVGMLIGAYFLGGRSEPERAPPRRGRPPARSGGSRRQRA